MILLNEVSQEDIERLHDNSFPTPVLSNLYVLKKSVVANGSVIAIALVRLTSEVLFLSDENVSLITRAKAVRMLEKPVKEDLKVLGLHDCHAFIKKSGRMSKILTHLGFEKLDEIVFMKGI